VQETGTSNFFLIDDNALLTKPVDEQFLPGITRDSLLTLAEEFDYDVIEQKFNVDSLLDWIKYGEAALCGTAAVLTSVAAFVYRDKRYEVCGGGHVARLKQALLDIQFGLCADRFGWMSADLRDTAPTVTR
jgi:branched-chain amino acid aminotransferase